MKNQVVMNINSKDFLGIIETYLKDTLGQEVRVNAKCTVEYTGIYEEKTDKVEISYTKHEKIGKYNAETTVTLSDKDIKEIFSILLPNYCVSYIFLESSTTDLYESCKEFISAELVLKEKEKMLTLKEK